VKKLLIKTLLRFLPCAFDATSMNRLHAGTVSLYLYKATDTDAIAQMVASGYFNSQTDVLRQGDVIIAIDPGTSVDVLTVSSVDNAATVTVVNGT
jgi:hypothetical protein